MLEWEGTVEKVVQLSHFLDKNVFCEIFVLELCPGSSAFLFQADTIFQLSAPL